LLAQGPLDVVIDQLALQGVAAEQVGGEEADLGIRRCITPGVFAREALVGLDSDDVALALALRTGLVDAVEPVIVDAQILRLGAVLVDAHPRDPRSPAHGHLPFRPVSSTRAAGIHAARSEE